MKTSLEEEDAGHTTKRTEQTKKSMAAMEQQELERAAEGE